MVTKWPTHSFVCFFMHMTIEIFNLILSNVEDKCPKDKFKRTPMFYFKGCHTYKKENWDTYFRMVFHPHSYC